MSQHTVWDILKHLVENCIYWLVDGTLFIDISDIQYLLFWDRVADIDGLRRTSISPF